MIKITLNVNNADQNQTPHHVAYFNHSHDEPHRRHCVVVLEQDTFILA